MPCKLGLYTNSTLCFWVVGVGVVVSVCVAGVGSGSAFSQLTSVTATSDIATNPNVARELVAMLNASIITLIIRTKQLFQPYLCNFYFCSLMFFIFTIIFDLQIYTCFHYAFFSYDFFRNDD